MNDRVFILIGKSKGGKSTLGNLLLGKKQFKVGDSRLLRSATQLVQSSEVTLSPGEVFGINKLLNIKVLDQPGMDDTNFEPTTHCNNLVKCMSDLNVKTFPTFLLVIDLESDRFLDDRCSLLTKLSFLLTQASYSLFSHTVVVFTHADRVCDDISNRDMMMQIVNEKCQKKEWGGLREILEEVHQRCIFVNGTNTVPRFRSIFLGELFELSKSILQIRFHGNNYFTSEYLKQKLEIKNDRIVEEELYKLDYRFHPDINLLCMEERRSLNTNELHSMISLGEGISSMVVLISLLARFTKKMEELINELPTHYKSESYPEFARNDQKWWNPVFIVFEVSDDASGEAFVEENLKLNPIIKTLVRKANNRWTWIARDTSVRMCRDRITDLCLRVRKEIGGKVFIKDTVLREIKEMMTQIDENAKTQEATRNLTLKQKLAQGGVNIDETKFWGIRAKRQMSVGSMRLILRNTMLSREELDRFREEYRDPTAKVSFEEVFQFYSPLLERSNENKAGLLQGCKPVNILCYGNNYFKCSELKFGLSKERVRNLPSEISLHYAQDLDMFDRFAVPVYTQEITQLIGEGVDIFLILIGLNTIFSQSMFDLLTSIPNILKFEEEDKQYFWRRAIIAFDVNDHLNPEDQIKKSMKGNIGIKRMVEMVGGRYTYLSTVEPSALVDGLVKQCLLLTIKHSGKELTGGKGQRGSPWTFLGKKGGGESNPKPEPTMNDRVFILIGKFKGGKSTLGNLLLGKNKFKVSNSKTCNSATQSVQSSEVTLSPGEVFGINKSINIKVIDQPGMDDTNIKPETHCDNLVKCMSDLNVKTFPTFLLVINLESYQFLDDGCSLLTKLSFLLTQASYSLFSHTVVVFTHADRVCDDIRNKDMLMRIVNEKCQTKEWGGLTEILEEVHQRCIFVNGTNTSPWYRSILLRELFELSKSILQIRFHGNDYFTSEYLKKKLEIKTDGIVEEELYNLDYQFHPDIWMEELRDMNMDEQLKRALQSMVALGEGISSMVVLINLFAPFSKQMEELINELPTNYISDFDPEFARNDQKWWNHVFIVFIVSDDFNGEAIVRERLSYHLRMKTLVGKANDRWTWIARDTSVRMCKDRITDLCLRVRKEIGGKLFINDTVIREIKEMMTEIDKKAKDTHAGIRDPTFRQNMALGAINYTLVANFWGVTPRHRTSVGSMSLILRNTMLSEEDWKRFRVEYKDPKAKVSFEEIFQFLISSLDTFV